MSLAQQAFSADSSAGSHNKSTLDLQAPQGSEGQAHEFAFSLHLSDQGTMQLMHKCERLQDSHPDASEPYAPIPGLAIAFSPDARLFDETLHEVFADQLERYGWDVSIEREDKESIIGHVLLDDDTNYAVVESAITRAWYRTCLGLLDLGKTGGEIPFNNAAHNLNLVEAEVPDGLVLESVQYDDGLTFDELVAIVERDERLNILFEALHERAALGDFDGLETHGPFAHL